MARKWYLRMSGFNPTVAASYVLPPSTNPPTCPGSGKICAIFAEAVDSANGAPIIDSCLLEEMIDALFDNTDTDNVLLRFTE